MSPARTKFRGAGFQMLSKEAQKKLKQFEHATICLMVCVATTSIVWSVTLHILSGDFYNGIIGAKLVFHERDFTQMNDQAKEIFYRDLDKLTNETYNAADAAAAAISKLNKAAAQEMLILPVPEQQETKENQTTTKKPKVRKIPHLFQLSSNLNVPDDKKESEEEEEQKEEPVMPKVKFDAVADRKFLSTMAIDIHQTHWRDGAAVSFVYSFPLLSEIIAIIWTAMCLIFQSGVKKYWGLPKPWRIVVPSIFMFSLMTVGTLIYTILANGFLKTFCTDLRENLSNPNAISCGQAISVLRPLIRPHEFRPDVFLNLLRISYMLTLVLWLLALLVMVLRLVFVIDFQVVDVRPTYNDPSGNFAAIVDYGKSEFTDVPLNSPKRQHQSQLLQVDELHKSVEDDFQSAKSHLSEVATPLLEHTLQPKVV